MKIPSPCALPPPSPAPHSQQAGPTVGVFEVQPVASQSPFVLYSLENSPAQAAGDIIIFALGDNSKDLNQL